MIETPYSNSFQCVHRTTPLGRIQGRIFCWTLPPHPCMDLPCYFRNLHHRSQFYQPYYFWQDFGNCQIIRKVHGNSKCQPFVLHGGRALRRGFTGQDFNHHLVFDPPSKVWIRSIREFVQRENMTSAAIVLDRSFGKLFEILCIMHSTTLSFNRSSQISTRISECFWLTFHANIS